ncbi:unnamed protein product [Ixodes hexagonus]
MDLWSVVKTLDRMAPLRMAAPWDNVGLLVEPSSCRVVRTVLLTNDLVPEVVQEASSLGADLIVSYHPPIFAPVKALRQGSWKERVLIQCVELGMAVYSPHTSWDAVRGGVNDWLSSCFDCASSEPVEKDSADPDAGMGRLLVLKAPLSVGEAASRVKAHLKLSSVRLALGSGQTAQSTVRAVAVCAGSGGSVLKAVPGAQLYLTGEMSHHEVLDAQQRGVSVLLCEHSYSERGYLELFAEKLRHELDAVTVRVSSADVGPLVAL